MPKGMRRPRTRRQAVVPVIPPLPREKNGVSMASMKPKRVRGKPLPPLLELIAILKGQEA